MHEIRFTIVNRGKAPGRFTADLDALPPGTLIGCQPACVDEGFEDLSFAGPAPGKTRSYTIKRQVTEAGRFDWSISLDCDECPDDLPWGATLVVLL
jgi:hypothetical protein